MLTAKAIVNEREGEGAAGLVGLVNILKAAAGLPHSKGRWRFSCQRGEADAILKCSLPAGESLGALYFVLLQSLTGNSDT